MNKSYIIAQYYHLDGAMTIDVYDDCVNEADALVALAEDQGYHDIPNVEGMEPDEARETLLNWFEDMDVSTEVKELPN